MPNVERCNTRKSFRSYFLNGSLIYELDYEFSFSHSSPNLYCTKIA